MLLLFPGDTDRQREGPVRCRERLGGLLREAAYWRDGRFSVLTLRDLGQQIIWREEAATWSTLHVHVHQLGRQHHVIFQIGHDH